ncbi:hypothetical protein [Glycomyces buryatensis]|uniref:Uncharacterized protein n=1 Tax=Glycomyces buryatensis TaxID=2570927 RepID=A0A4S8QR33_9ACTN|nr:hypothetical protein [Glycomyces buryatensis]THV43124.1 hypothetical protein FAB82_02515 [Glycomyces buryatensis]
MDPIFIAIASAVVGKTTEATIKGGAKVAELVRRRFGKDDDSELVLLRAETGRASKEDLAEAVARLCAQDPEFREALSALVGQELPVAEIGNQTQFNNTFNGSVGNVLQAGNIENLRLD